MSNDYYCITIPKDKKEEFESALADILCWMDGFTQGGGKYSADSIYKLRDIRDMIQRGYQTIEPKQPKSK